MPDWLISFILHGLECAFWCGVWHALVHAIHHHRECEHEEKVEKVSTYPPKPVLDLPLRSGRVTLKHGEKGSLQ